MMQWNWFDRGYSDAITTCWSVIEFNKWAKKLPEAATKKVPDWVSIIKYDWVSIIEEKSKSSFVLWVFNSVLRVNLFIKQGKYI